MNEEGNLAKLTEVFFNDLAKAFPGIITSIHDLNISLREFSSGHQSKFFVISSPKLDFEILAKQLLDSGLFDQSGLKKEYKPRDPYKKQKFWHKLMYDWGCFVPKFIYCNDDQKIFYMDFYGGNAGDDCMYRLWSNAISEKQALEISLKNPEAIFSHSMRIDQLQLNEMGDVVRRNIDIMLYNSFVLGHIFKTGEATLQDCDVEERNVVTKLIDKDLLRDELEKAVFKIKELASSYAHDDDLIHLKDRLDEYKAKVEETKRMLSGDFSSINCVEKQPKTVSDFRLRKDLENYEIIVSQTEEKISKLENKITGNIRLMSNVNTKAVIDSLVEIAISENSLENAVRSYNFSREEIFLLQSIYDSFLPCDCHLGNFVLKDTISLRRNPLDKTIYDPRKLKQMINLVKNGTLKKIKKEHIASGGDTPLLDIMAEITDGSHGNPYSLYSSFGMIDFNKFGFSNIAFAVGNMLGHAAFAYFSDQRKNSIVEHAIAQTIRIFTDYDPKFCSENFSSFINKFYDIVRSGTTFGALRSIGYISCLMYGRIIHGNKASNKDKLMYLDDSDLHYLIRRGVEYLRKITFGIPKYSHLLDFLIALPEKMGGEGIN